MAKSLLKLVISLLVVLNSFEISAQTNTNTDSVNIWKLSLEEVLTLNVVSAQKTEKSVNKTPASVIVITRKEIEKYGFRNLQEILNHIPGLYLWNGYHVRGRVNIGVRGYTSSDNIIILVNGVNQVEGMYNEYLLTKVAVPVDAIDRIEVVRGPMSVLYGSGAFFGVINIITNDINKNTKKSASLVYGSDNYTQGTIRANAIEHELKIGATLSAFRTDGMDRPYDEMMSDPSQLTNWGLSEDETTAGTLLDKNAYFNLTMKYKGLVADMTHTEVERGGFLVQPTIQYSPSKRHSTNFMMSYNHEFSNKLHVMGKLSYLTTNSLSFYYLNEEDSYLSFGYNSDAYELEVNSFYKPIDKMEITLGVFHRNVYYANNPAELSAVWGVPYGLHLTKLDINSRMIENSVYSQVNYELTHKLNVIGGIRMQQMLPFKYHASGGAAYPSDGRQVYYDTYEFEKLYFIPQISAIYGFNDNNVLKLLYGEALRNPPLGIITDILFSTADDVTFDYPQLVPSQIRTYELNYSGLIGKRLSIHASVFRNELKNLISQYFINLNYSSTVYYSSNKGKITTHGLEFALQYNPVDELNLSASIAYQKSEDETPGIEKVDVAY
ncbi:MAG: hypothetical protein C0599_06445 [Salinivirgaceae bacterium]|nr:MAG: hypothetical protein C0599_06445 [Salinivirgaceae bacterium]